MSLRSTVSHHFKKCRGRLQLAEWSRPQATAVRLHRATELRSLLRRNGLRGAFGSLPAQGLLAMTSSLDAMKEKFRQSRMVQEAAAQHPEVRRKSGGALPLRGQTISADVVHVESSHLLRELTLFPDCSVMNLQ